jgi:tetratricopeptide (TPR) repeat protein
MMLGVIGGGPAPEVAPPAGEPAPASQPEAAGQLVGSSSCRPCHERFYQLWAPSHHGLAMQPYSAAFAKAHLTPHAGPTRVGRHSYRVDVSASAGWMLETGPQGERKLPMVHVLGGKNVYYFLTPGEGGRLQTLPLAYDVRRREWFDTAGSGMRHFPGGEGDDSPLHWMDREYTFNASCYSCHVSQLSTNYDLRTDTYRTVWAEPGINCETCHGPGAEHVRVCRAAADGDPPADLKIVTVTQSRGFTAEQVDATCVPCHAQMAPVTPSFKPGERYFDHYDLVTLEDPDFYPDGRDLGENYTYTLWRLNPCAREGGMDCVHCHTSSGRFRFKDDPNRSCLPCHAARVADVAAHAHHPADSEGSLCIRCHMPMTEFARMKRSDHSLLPPTPAATIAFESPNACTLCHPEEGAAWADKHVREWHARDYQQPVLHRAGLIAAARKEDWSKLPDMLAYLEHADREEVFVSGLIRLLRGCERPEVWAAMPRMLKDASPLVRAAAAEALDGRITADALRGLLGAVRDPYRLVRVRAAATLAVVPRAWLDEAQREAVEVATAEFLGAMHARPDDHASHYNLGNFYMDRGELEQAIACYTRATKLQPRDVAPYVNASLAYNALGRNAEAERSLRAALKVDPKNAAAQLNLGMLLAELGRPKEAEAAFRAAFEHDPTSARAAYNLGVILAEGRLEEALDWCRKAHALRPGEPKYAYTLAYYLHQARRTVEAIRVLRASVVAGAVDPDLYALLGGLHEERGEIADALAVFQQAAGDERLPPQARQAFAARAAGLSRR